jgi:hypothetical protein
MSMAVVVSRKIDHSVQRGLMFFFLRIPRLDAYLAKRYGVEFSAYGAKTKKLALSIY